MEDRSHEEQNPIRGTCPSCHSQTSYTFLGIQRWPEQVAQRLGVPSEQAIWQCCSCRTSVMEDSIVRETIHISA